MAMLAGGIGVIFTTGIVVPIVIGVIAVTVSFMLLVAGLGKIRESEMIMSPGRDMKKLWRDNFRIIYSTSSGHELKALALWKGLQEITAAISRETLVIKAEETLSRNRFVNIVQGSLNKMKTALTNVRDTAIVRGFFDSFHLSRNEEFVRKVHMLFNVVVFVLVISVVLQLATFTGLFAVKELANLVLAGEFLSFSEVFAKPFYVLEIGKAIFTSYELQSPFTAVILAFTQTAVFGTTVIMGLWLALGKFVFYFLGDNARHYPQEKVVTSRRVWLNVGIGAAAAIAFAVIPGGSWLAVIGRAVSAVFVGISVFRFFIMRTASTRFKAIVEQDKLLTKDSPMPRVTALTEAQWDEMKRESFDNFVDTVLSRYNAEEQRVILKANEVGKENLSDMEKMVYERTLGRGAEPSRSKYKNFDRASLEEEYKKLTTENLLNRMSGAGFENLKRALGLDCEDLKLWHIQSEDESIKFIANSIKDNETRKKNFENSRNAIKGLSPDVLRDIIDGDLLERRVVLMYDL
ncbi:MAG TPA: hypothetical protein PKZ41_05165, partial [Candidatus Omnitrophota bacterium]|nr:hypothetical protein [Candidatus Omnitrophota bacterium]